MSSTFRLGRVAGIEIGVNWTWFFVVVLVTWSLASFVFPDQNPGLGTSTYWAMAAVAALLFFASILLHELGHALQAQRDDVDIEGITLWLLGGVAKFRSLYRTPGAEFRIAVAGPLVTVAIAVVLILAGWALALPTAVEGVVFWLAYINVVVLLFNLVPALPLDGGRVLHAALWRARDQQSATRAAAGIGKAFGYFLIAAGVFALFAGAGLGAAWFVLLGWFISMAAEAESQHLLLRHALADLHVRDLMARDVVTVAPEMSVGQFMDEIARETRFTTYPVVDDARAVGLLSFRKVADVPRDEWDERRVRDCMHPLDDVATVSASDPASAAMTTLMSSEINRALVLSDGRLEGIISITDLARAAQTAR